MQVRCLTIVTAATAAMNYVFRQWPIYCCVISLDCMARATHMTTLLVMQMVLGLILKLTLRASKTNLPMIRIKDDIVIVHKISSKHRSGIFV